MSVADTVRGRLKLSRELLTQTDFHGQNTAEDTAAYVLLAHDAATLALAAICQQLGRPSDKTKDGLLDCLVWLRAHTHPDRAFPGMDYLVDLHKARIELQDRYLLPEIDHWSKVRETTLAYIESWSQRLLGVELNTLLFGIPGFSPHQDPKANAGSDSQRRVAARYECAGEAEVRIPFAGPPSKAKIINLSIGGCYAEMEDPFEVGRRVEIVLLINRLSFRATGKVVYSQWGHAGDGLPTRYENPGIGIQFTAMSSGGRDRLMELLSELQAHSPDAKLDHPASSKP